MYTCRQARYSNKRCIFNKHFQNGKIENYVIENIKDIIKGVRDIESYVDYTTSITDDRITKIERELERVKQAYLVEVFTLEEYKNERQRLEGELKVLEIDKFEENRKLKMKKKIKFVYDKFISAKSVQDKKVILQEIIDSIKISKDSIIICFKA